MAGVALGDIHPSLCAAGGALGHIHLHFAWQAWHLTTSIVTLHGRRSTYGTGLALVAHVVTRWRGGAAALWWQAWHLVTSTFTLCGRRGTWSHPPSLCVACVALGDIHLHFAWQAWHLVTSTLHFAWQAWHLVTSTLHFAWQAWHLTTSIVTLRGKRTYGTGLALVAHGHQVARWRRGSLRGRRGTS